MLHLKNKNKKKWGAIVSVAVINLFPSIHNKADMALKTGYATRLNEQHRIQDRGERTEIFSQEVVTIHRYIF